MYPEQQEDCYYAAILLYVYKIKLLYYYTTILYYFPRLLPQLRALQRNAMHADEHEDGGGEGDWVKHDEDGPRHLGLQGS